MMGKGQNIRGIKAELNTSSKVVTGYNLPKWLHVDLPLVSKEKNNHTGKENLYYAQARKEFLTLH